MKLVTFDDKGTLKVGLLDGDEVVDLSKEYECMVDLITAGDVQEIKERSSIQRTLNLKDAKLCAPIPNPMRNIICIGWNYLEHFEERHRQDIELPKVPTVFSKATKTAAGPYDNIHYSKRVTEKFDYEAELGIIIGKEGKNISTENAEEFIFGYLVANDLSARDLQQSHGGQWFMGKSLDETCPMGPWIVTKDEIDDIQNLEISCLVNGEEVQKSNTELMMFSINEIIHHLSKGMTLLPGDIILTGTPSGVGFKRNPPLLLGDGDVVEVIIEKIGTIRNKIKVID